MADKMFVIEDGILTGYLGGEATVHIPAGVRKIGHNAFSENNHIRTVFVPEGVESICDFSFDDCRNLRQLHLPQSLRKIGCYAFLSCARLMEVSLPDGLKRIERGAFEGCKRLSRINIPVGAEVDGGAFYGCPLVEPDFGNRTDFSDVRDSGLRAAANRCVLCGGVMEESDDDSGMTCTACHQSFSWSNIDHWENFAMYEGVCVRHIHGGGELPSGTRKIGHRAFDDHMVPALEIPDSVTEIEAEAFLWCDFALNPHLPDQLKRLEYDTFCGSGISWISLPDQLEYLGAGSLSACSGISELDIPDSVAVIGPYALNSCSGLRKVHLGAGVRLIEQAALAHCEVLKEVRCPDNLEMIGDYAFSDCHSLDMLTLNNGLLFIGGEAFAKCKKLTSVKIPRTVQHIGMGAFCGCHALEKAWVPESLRYLDLRTVFPSHTKIEYYP